MAEREKRERERERKKDGKPKVCEFSQKCQTKGEGGGKGGAR